MAKGNVATMKSQTAPMTFAEAYLNSKRLHKARSSTTALAIPKDSMNLARCHKELSAFASSLETEDSNSLGKMKGLLNVLPKQLYDGFTYWVDNRNMDVLQLCIAFDRVDIISLLLENEELFPESYQPALNPYAHLAAWLGYKDSLDALLRYRPGFYFKTSKPQHVIKLHKNIQPRLKVSNGSSSINKYVHKMLKKVGDAPLKAEKAWETIGLKKKWEIESLDSELSALEVKTTRKAKTLRSSSVSFDVSEAERIKRMQAGSVIGLSGRGFASPATHCATGLGKGEHVITVYDWDFLDEESEGVTKCTGPVVEFLRPEDRREKRMARLRLPKIDDVRALNRHSRLVLNQRASGMPDIAFSSKSMLDFASNLSVGKSVRNIASNSSYNNNVPQSTNRRNRTKSGSRTISSNRRNVNKSYKGAPSIKLGNITNSKNETFFPSQQNVTNTNDQTILSSERKVKNNNVTFFSSQKNVTNSYDDTIYANQLKAINSENGIISSKHRNITDSNINKSSERSSTSSVRSTMSSRKNNHSDTDSLGLSSSSVSSGKHRSQTSTTRFKKIELGVRTIKKYKDFQVVIDSRKLQFRDDKHMNKTPLTIAAEKGHLECVKFLLQHFLLKQHPMLTAQEPLTLATKARSPEAIAILLTGKYTRDDYQSAILTALRDFYPACLTVLLNSENKERSQMFDGENLFHILYSQSLSADFRYEMMPEMTRTLISCREEVNARGPESTHPMYTLISCAFNIRASRQCLYYLECLKILLGARANPHYNEIKDDALVKPGLTLSRQLYYSAIHCIFASAYKSTSFFEKPYWSKVIMQKFIECIVVNDKTPRRILNDVLFSYMDFVTQLGLDRKVLRSLFRYGANPDYKHDEKYAMNRFFDQMIPFLTQFEVSSQKTSATFDGLMMVCDAMSPDCLHEAFVTFLDEHLLRTPLQALTLTRQFCYEVNQEIRNPRSLVKLTGNFIWKTIRRSDINASKLHLDENLLGLICNA